MSKISLSRALQVKNRLAEAISTQQRIVHDYNSRVAQVEPEFDVQQCYDTYVKLQEHMVDLKSKINYANSSVQHVIYELAELKGRVQMLKNLDTRNGSVPAAPALSWEKQDDSKLVTYMAVFTKPKIADMVRELENRIDDLQSQLEYHNHQTFITVDTSWLD